MVRQVKLAYYDLAYLDEALRITGEEEQLLLHYETLARPATRRASGSSRRSSSFRPRSTRVLNRRQELLRQRTDFEALLNVLANRPVNAPVPPVTIGERPEVALDDEQLHATGLDERPRYGPPGTGSSATNTE